MIDQINTNPVWNKSFYIWYTFMSNFLMYSERKFKNPRKKCLSVTVKENVANCDLGTPQAVRWQEVEQVKIFWKFVCSSSH